MWRIAGICFDHFHMGDLLRMAHEHPNAEIVGICDEWTGPGDRMAEARASFSIPSDRVWSRTEDCLETSRPDVIILCPAAARHAEWVERVAPFQSAAVMVEKPFANSVAEADRMVAAMEKSSGRLAINWPLAWRPSHVKCHELVSSGTIGEIIGVSHYGGNRGPLYHGADKSDHKPTDAEKSASWFYRESEGGGSLRDYLGYGTTLTTWFNGGQRPSEVIAMWDHHPASALEVDEHSIVVARYATGLSKFETRWGTLSDPWTQQPEPHCGFVITGTDGTISSWDYDEYVTLRTPENPAGEKIPAPKLEPPMQNPIAYIIDCLEKSRPFEGPLNPVISRIGQEIVDAAIESARWKRAVTL